MTEYRDPCTTLHAEVMRAFAMLAEVPMWQRDFNSAAASRKAKLYEKPLAGISLDCVLPGVEYIIATSDFPPSPNKLATACWRIHRERYPEAPTSSSALEDADRKAEALRLEKIQRRFTERAAYLREKHQITTTRELGEVWAYVMRMATTPAHRKAVTEGAVKTTTLDAAVAEYRREKAQAERFTAPSKSMSETVESVVKKTINL